MHLPRNFASINQATLLLATLLLIGCSPAGTPTQPPDPLCADGLCSGTTLTTYINSPEIGDIAVLVTFPLVPRFPDGAGVVVVVPPFFGSPDGFGPQPDLTAIGLVQITLLWPGESDATYAVASQGEYDYGGPLSIQALRDVILFSTARMLDVNGRSISTLIPSRPMVDEVGLFAFDHAGMAAVNVLAQYGDTLDGVEYFVGYENPTLAHLASFEVGHYSSDGQIQPNPFYTFPADYSPLTLAADFGTLRWDENASSDTGLSGYPYLDLDGDLQAGGSDYRIDVQAAQMFGKTYYSPQLTQALLDSGALTPSTWPATLATPAESLAVWDFRQSTNRYLDLAQKTPDLKVMLVFATSDHAQVASDKPHIHQAFQGFRFAAQLRWVRLNPDRAYFHTITSYTGSDLPDNPVNTQPEDWLTIRDWCYPGGGALAQMAPIVALAEMSDRAHTARWDDNLGDVLYEYVLTPTQP